MSEPPPLPSPGELFADRYQIESGLGGGFDSQVLGAIDRETGRRVAVKCWTGPHAEQAVSSVRAFMRAAYASGAYEHPNLVEVFSAEIEANVGYCVTEWLEGTTLARELQRVRPSPLEAVYEHVLPCMRAIAEAHAAGIVHGDLRPGHIFLCRATRHRGARPRVFDFGCGMPGFHELRAHKRPTLDEACHYTSPEQLQSAPLDARSDQYAFGVILYEMLAGHLPFTADNGNDLALEIVAGSAKPLAEIRNTLPDGLSDVVARAMATDPADRFPDLTSFIEALEAFDGRNLAPLPSVPLPSAPRLRSPALHAPSAPVMSAYDWSFQDSSEPRPVAIPAPPARNTMFLPRAALAGAITAAVISAVYLDEDLFDRLSPPSAASSPEPRRTKQRVSAPKPAEAPDPLKTSTSYSAIEHAPVAQPAAPARTPPRPAQPHAAPIAPTTQHPSETRRPAEPARPPSAAVPAQPGLGDYLPSAAHGMAPEPKPAAPAPAAVRDPEPIKPAVDPAPSAPSTRGMSAVERRIQQKKANAAKAIQRLEKMQLQ